MKKQILSMTRLLLLLAFSGLLLTSAIHPTPIAAQGEDLDIILARATIKGYLISLKRGSSGPSALADFYLTSTIFPCVT